MSVQATSASVLEQPEEDALSPTVRLRIVVAPCFMLMVIDWVAGEIYAGRRALNDVGAGFGTVMENVVRLLIAVAGDATETGSVPLPEVPPLQAVIAIAATAVRMVRNPGCRFITTPS